MTMFVLSPSVEATTASASSMPARRRTSVSMPCPTTKPPVQSSPRRESADSFSSTAVTSQPSAASRFATVDPTLPHPMTIACIKSTVALFAGFRHPRRTDRDRRLCGRRLAVERALWEGDDQDFRRRFLEDVVDCRREEPRLATPAGGRAEDDQVRSEPLRLADDRLADRPRPD